MVSDSGSTISRRPIAERPMPESTDRCSNRSSLERRPGRRAVAVRSTRSASRSRRSARRAAATRRRAARTARSTSWPMCTSSGSHPTMLVVSRTSASSSSATTAITYGGAKSGEPLVGVHGEAHDGAATRDRRGLPGRLRQTGQIGTGGWTSVAAVGAALDAEPAVGARGPEPLGGRRQLGQRLRGGWPRQSRRPQHGDDLGELDARADARRGGAHEGDGVDRSMGRVAGRHCSHVGRATPGSGWSTSSGASPSTDDVPASVAVETRTDPGPWCNTRSHETARSSRPSRIPDTVVRCAATVPAGQGAGSDLTSWASRRDLAVGLHGVQGHRERLGDELQGRAERVAQMRDPLLGEMTRRPARNP